MPTLTREESSKPNFNKVEYFKGVPRTIVNETNETYSLDIDQLDHVFELFKVKTTEII